ncbi:hypothetical protein [Kineococcus rhizosphaerae]|uniref:Uncharacterized protein n=1 Tax=Kineococcus rhizosphaerae TaxID=559628 RepID=A0A2T0QLN6_9ACTN|nr:hypothetical protein [Kineococcus rhizosphaerae]PRY05392.1 hypothetical protein CLV37_1394 [Kineococcus rhizosphaerae]
MRRLDPFVRFIVAAIVGMCVYAVLVPGANIAALGLVAGVLIALTPLVRALTGGNDPDPDE